MRTSSWGSVLFVGWLLGCDSGGVGDPCVPEEEFSSRFSGFSILGATVESGSFQCSTRLCLMNHFQGRVSCPEGQSEADLELSSSDSKQCFLPGTDGSDEADAIAVPVQPWDLDRPAARTVYCSCRCEGPDPNARYCKCPSGFECRPLIPETGLGQDQLVGSYCIREGTAFSDGEVGGPTCGDRPDDPACEPSPLLSAP